MSNFITNVLKLVSGSVVAQALGILLIPIITRIYCPDDFGIFQLFTSISSIIATISCFSYHLSIMLPKKDEDSVNIVVLCIILVIFTSIISGIVFIIFSKWIGNLLNTPVISNYMIFLPIIVFLNGLFLTMNYWLSRRVRFGVIAAARVANTVSSRAVQIWAGIGGASPLGLIFGSISGYALADLFMLKGVKKKINIFKNVSFEKIKELAIRYKKFPMFTTWSALANAVSVQVPVFMLAFFFNPVVVGFYSLANVTINLPMSLIGSATGQVFFQKVAEEKNKTGSVKNVVSEVYRRLISIGIFPMIILLIISGELFGFAFGSIWYIAGVYAKILIPWLFLVFISSPLSTLFSVLEKQGMGLSFNLTLLISRITALYIGGSRGDPIFALILFSITGVIFWSGMNFYLLKISGVRYREGFWVLVKFLLIALIISVPLMIAKYFSLPLYSLFIVAGVVTLVYYLVIIFEDMTLREELFRIIKRVKR